MKSFRPKKKSFRRGLFHVRTRYSSWLFCDGLRFKLLLLWAASLLWVFAGNIAMMAFVADDAELSLVIQIQSEQERAATREAKSLQAQDATRQI